MNVWQQFLSEVSKYRVGAPMSRRVLLYVFENRLDGKQIDNYRLHLMRAGFLEEAGRGKYRVVKKIPTELGWRECIRLAYPKRAYGKKTDKGELVSAEILPIRSLDEART